MFNLHVYTGRRGMVSMSVGDWLHLQRTHSLKVLFSSIQRRKYINRLHSTSLSLGSLYESEIPSEQSPPEERGKKAPITTLSQCITFVPPILQVPQNIPRCGSEIYTDPIKYIL